MSRAFAVTMLLLLTVTAAHAGPTSQFVHTDTVTIDGTEYGVYEVRVTVDSDWTAARMDISLTTGSMYNHPSGGNTKPTAGQIAALPDMAHDTYAAAPNDGTVTFAGDVTMDATTFSCAWGDQVDTGPGTWTIAQVTLSADAGGPISATVYESSAGNAAPVAGAGGPYVVLFGAGAETTLNAGGSTDPDNDIFAYLWDLDGNGSYETDGGAEPTATVTRAQLESLGLAAGTWLDVSAKVIDSEWLSDTDGARLILLPEGTGPGDADGDGLVEDRDLSLVLSNWGTAVGWDGGEFDGTSPVEDRDLSILLANWTGSGGGAVPDPASALVLLLGMCAMRRRCK